MYLCYKIRYIPVTPVLIKGVTVPEGSGKLLQLRWYAKSILKQGRREIDRQTTGSQAACTKNGNESVMIKKLKGAPFQWSSF